MQINIPFTGKALLFSNGLIDPPRIVAAKNHRNSAENDPSWEHFKALLYGYSGGDMPITADTAVQVATVLRCVDVVAKDIASMPLHLFMRTGKGAEKAKELPLYEMLHSLPNRETTAFDFWLMYVYNLLLTPAAFAYVERDRNGFITAMHNLPSKYCRLKRNEQTGERYAEYYNGKVRTTIYPENLMYTLGARLSDADNPLDPIVLAGKVLGLTNSLNDFADKYFKNGTQSSGVVTLVTAAGEAAFNQFKKDFSEMYTGVQNSSKVMFLNGNSKYEKLTNNPNDSQALESRQHQVIEVCRMFGVSPIKVFEYGRATYSNMEQVNIEYVTQALNPMAVRLEQTITRDLIPSFQRAVLYAKWNFYGLLKGDTAAQTAHIHALRQDGIKSANEIRELMDENRIPAEDGGDAYLVNGNMISLKTAMNAQPKSTGTTPAK